MFSNLKMGSMAAWQHGNWHDGIPGIGVAVGRLAIETQRNAEGGGGAAAERTAGRSMSKSTYHSVLVLVRYRFSACMHALATYQAAPPPPVTTLSGITSQRGMPVPLDAQAMPRCRDAMRCWGDYRPEPLAEFQSPDSAKPGRYAALGLGGCRSEGTTGANQIGRWGSKRPV